MQYLRYGKIGYTKVMESEFAKRRREFAGRLPNGSVSVLFSGDVSYMTAGIHYRFRQNSNFFYLSNFTEPNSVLVFHKLFSGHTSQYLFVEEKSSSSEIWNGYSAGPELAKEVLKFENVLPISSFLKEFKRMASESKSLFAVDNDQLRKLAGLVSSKEVFEKKELFLSHSILNELRIRKSSAEAEMLKDTMNITASAFNSVMTCPDLHNMWESDVENLFEYECKNGNHCQR